jgi:hypothetical protein
METGRAEHIYSTAVRPVRNSAPVSIGHLFTIARVTGFHGLCPMMQHRPPGVSTRLISSVSSFRPSF